MTKEEALKTYFGYDAFRGGQEEIIDALLSGRDALAIMPTGAGKSVCYQIPALLLPGQFRRAEGMAGEEETDGEKRGQGQQENNQGA